MKITEEQSEQIREFSDEETRGNFYKIEHLFVQPIFKGAIGKMAKDWASVKSKIELKRKISKFYFELFNKYELEDVSFGYTKSIGFRCYFNPKKKKIFISENLVNFAIKSKEGIFDLIYVMCHELAHAMEYSEIKFDDDEHGSYFFHLLMLVLKAVSGNSLFKVSSRKVLCREYGEHLTLDEYALRKGTFTRAKKGSYQTIKFCNYNALINSLSIRCKHQFSIPVVTIMNEKNEVVKKSHFDFYSRDKESILIKNKNNDKQGSQDKSIIINIKRSESGVVASIRKIGKIKERENSSYFLHLNYLKETNKCKGKS